MKPTALLHSCDKNFSKEFKINSQDKLNIVSENFENININAVRYQFIYVGDDEKYLESISRFHRSNLHTVIVIHSSLASKSHLLKTFSNAKIIYYQDLISNFSSNFSLDLIKKSHKNSISIPVHNNFLYSITMPELVSAMHEAAFTFFSNTQHSLFIHDGMTAHNLAGLLQQSNPKLKITFNKNAHKNINPPAPVVTLKPNSEYVVDMFNNLKTNAKSFELDLSFEMPKISINKPLVTKVAVTAFSLPVFLFALSVLTLYLGYWGIDKNVDFSSANFAIAEKISLNRSFRESARLGGRVLAVTDSQEFDLASASPNELRNYLAELKVSLNSLYKDMSFNKDLYLFSDLISQNRELVLTVHNVVEIAPILLGLNSQTSYAVVFEKDNLATEVLYFEAKDAYINYSAQYSYQEIDEKMPGQVASPFDPEEQWSFKHLTWEGDFPAVSNRTRWFLNKSHDLNPDHVIMVSSDSREMFEKIVKTDKFLLNLEFLSNLLAISKSNKLAANSVNVSAQAFFENENLSSKSATDLLSFYIDEFAQDGIRQIDRRINALVELEDENTFINYKITYKNTTDSDYSFWSKLITNSEHAFEESNLNPKFYKNLDKKIAEQYVRLEPEESIVLEYRINASDINNEFGININFAKNIFVENMPISVEIESDHIGQIETTPHMNLTSSGVLSYTTSLEQPIELSIKF